MPWPSTLPIPRRVNYSHTASARLIRTPIETGPERRRRISTDDNNSVPVTMYLTDSQRQIFINQVWNGIANGGADLFDLPLVGDNGAVFDHEVYMGDYTMTRTGQGHMVSFEVTFRERK